VNGHLNLARRPFVNARPVTRVALLLWVLGGLLLLGNVTLFWSYLSGSTEKREELARMREEVERERQAVDRLQARIAGIDLARQNEQVEFLNRKIAERTFSWSLLFDRLTQVLPNDVRLIQLHPTPIAAERPGEQPTRGQPRSSDQVLLSIQGEAKSDEALLQFVDRLFAHPAFKDPDLARETRDEEDQDRLSFELRVTYLPGETPQEVIVEEAPVIEEGTPPPAPETPADIEGETE
jgi:Tfp pilus assembly protein PilN